MMHFTETTSNLLAYVDPGSGAMLVQAMIASVVGASAWFSGKLFKRKKGTANLDELDSDDDATSKTVDPNPSPSSSSK
jgi:hypothetical protein